MIPKKINYIWLGGKDKSNFTNICLMSWYEHLSGYEIMEWNEKNLDLDKLCSENRFLAECKKRKLWAFMADYLRLYILYNYGGIYMDVDVQVIKNFDDLLDNPMFIGYEYFSKDKANYVTEGTGIIASEPYNPVIGDCLAYYDQKIWETDVYYIPTIFTKVFQLHDESEYVIFPVDYFAPYDYRKCFNFNCVTENTHTIHWFQASWHENKNIGLFLQTKHIKNPIKKKIVQLKKMAGYYKRKSYRIVKAIFS